MTLKTIVQDCCYEVGFPDAPTSVIGNNDFLQHLRLLNREGRALAKWPWQSLVKEDTITLATSDQDYALASDFGYILPHTQWNRDDQRTLVWLNSQEWQFFKGWTSVNGLNLRARIRNDELEFEQTIEAGDNGKVIAYEYVSNAWCETSGGTGQTDFAADTDVGAVDEELLTLGLIWRFKKAKGIDFSADLAEYNHQVKLAKAQDGGARKLRMTGRSYTYLTPNTQEGDYPSA